MTPTGLNAASRDRERVWSRLGAAGDQRLTEAERQGTQSATPVSAGYPAKLGGRRSVRAKGGLAAPPPNRRCDQPSRSRTAQTSSGTMISWCPVISYPL